MLGDVGQWVQGVIASLGYVGLALLLVLENLFPPLPSEVVLPIAGFFVGRGDPNLFGALSLRPGSVGWALVLRYGAWLRASAGDLDRDEGWFAKYGDLVVLGARGVPFARSVVSIPAGTSR
nr:DedA family protein [Actinomycetota bacterium]